MTYRIRVLSGITAAAVMVATVAGCGAIGSAKHFANNVGTLGDMSQKITDAEKLTYRADYTDTDGAQYTVAQAPPKSAYLSQDSDWIYDGTSIYSCDTENSALTCEKTESTGTADPETALAAGGFAGGEFFTGAFGVALLAGAMLVPDTKVDKDTKKIAGLTSTCVSVSGIPGTEEGSEDIVSFDLCVADNGVVTSFAGTDTTGKKGGVTMTSFSTSVDDSVFQPPAGATITDAGALPTALPTGLPTGLPSDFPTGLPSGFPSLLPSPLGSPS